MKNFIKLLAVTTLTASVAACSDSLYGDLSGEGTVKLTATINNDVKVESRALTEQELAEKCIIWISNPSGAVRKYQGIDALPTEGVKLVSGSYVAEAWTGDSVPASFDDKYYKAREPFEVADGQTSQVTLTCRVANVVVSVDIDPDLDALLTDMNMHVAHTRGSLDFAGHDDRKGYFMMPTGVDFLDYTFTGRLADGSEFTRTGVIADVKPTTEYAMHVKCTSSTDPLGGGFLTIEVDESELLVEETITIATAPRFEGYGFDLSQKVTGSKGTIGRHSVWALASAGITSMVLEEAHLASLLGISGNDVDLLQASDAVLAKVRAGGITSTYEYFDEDDTSRMKIAFEEALLNSLENGEYNFKLTATDANGRISSATLQVVVSDAPIATEAVEADAVTTWATHATIYGTILQAEECANPRFQYRASGSSTWSEAPATVSGTALSAELTGLTPGTTYQYRAVCDDYEAAAILTFATEAAQQPQNAGFEYWQTSSSPYLVYGSGQQMYWDTGNHGSAMLNVNVTTPASSPLHSGNYSACLKSQYVGIGIIGKLAAGNVFIGQYLATDGTDGILGFGRSHTSRPTALKGYLRYEPGTVDYTSSSVPDIVSGQPDKGIIYVAILDDSQLETYVKNGTTYSFPFIIKTASSSRRLFDKNSANVIAYGEKVLSATTSESGLVEFEIPIDYNTTAKKAKYIIITCAASKGGDYFAGSSSSTLYVDDLELVY